MAQKLKLVLYIEVDPEDNDDSLNNQVIEAIAGEPLALSVGEMFEGSDIPAFVVDAEYVSGEFIDV